MCNVKVYSGVSMTGHNNIRRQTRMRPMFATKVEIQSVGFTAGLTEKYLSQKRFQRDKNEVY